MKHRRCAPNPPLSGESREQALLRRARRFRRRGEHRRALLALRTACLENQGDPRLWTLYAAECARQHRRDDAAHALRQALWLRKRSRDAARARVTRTLIERLDLSGVLAEFSPRAA
jgi:Flp pilus assembly protein TadD